MLQDILDSFSAQDYPTRTLELIGKIESDFLSAYNDEPEEFKSIGACFVDALKTYIAESYVVRRKKPDEARSIFKTELFLLARELISHNPFTQKAQILIDASIGTDCELDFTTLDKKTVAVVRYNADKENMNTLISALDHSEKGIVRVCTPMESYNKRDFRTLCKGLLSFIRTHEGKKAAYYHLRASENLVTQRLAGQAISNEEAECYQHISKKYRFPPFEELHKQNEARLKQLKKTIREHARIQQGGERTRIRGISELINFLDDKAQPIFSREDHPSLITVFEEYLTGTVNSEYIKEWLEFGSSYA